MSSVLKATIENKTTSVPTTHFKKVTTGNNVFIVSVIVCNCHMLQFLHQNVQCVRLAAGRRTQAGDATDQWRDQWNAATVCPTQWRHTSTWGVVGSLVIVLLQIFSWLWEWNDFENRLVFGKVKACKTMVPIFGPPCMSAYQRRSSLLFLNRACTASGPDVRANDIWQRTYRRHWCN